MTVSEQVHAEEELNRKLSQYAGRWVAVIDHDVVQNAIAWDELVEQLTIHQREQAELFYVSDPPGALHLY